MGNQPWLDRLMPDYVTRTPGNQHMHACSVGPEDWFQAFSGLNSLKPCILSTSWRKTQAGVQKIPFSTGVILCLLDLLYNWFVYIHFIQFLRDINQFVQFGFPQKQKSWEMQTESQIGIKINNFSVNNSSVRLNMPTLLCSKINSAFTRTEKKWLSFIQGFMF